MQLFQTIQNEYAKKNRIENLLDEKRKNWNFQNISFEC